MISPVIHFSGNCLEAIILYEQAFNSTDKQVSFYREAPYNNGMNITKDMLDLVMHSTITLSGTKFNMSDTTHDLNVGDMVCFNVFMDTEAEVINAYEVLSHDGEIVQEIGPQFFSKLYAVVVDRFGIRWQLMTA